MTCSVHLSTVVCYNRTPVLQMSGYIGPTVCPYELRIWASGRWVSYKKTLSSVLLEQCPRIVYFEEQLLCGSTEQYPQGWLSEIL